MNNTRIHIIHTETTPCNVSQFKLSVYSIDPDNFNTSEIVTRNIAERFYKYNSKKQTIVIKGTGFSKHHDIIMKLEQFIKDNNITNCKVY